MNEQKLISTAGIKLFWKTEQRWKNLNKCDIMIININSKFLNFFPNDFN